MLVTPQINVVNLSYRFEISALLFSSLILVNFEEAILMEGPLRGILAGAAAWKLGGGLISTIIIFLVVFWLLGKC
jgi:hypothetical protein